MFPSSDDERRESKRPGERELTTAEFGHRILAHANSEVEEPYGDGLTKVTYFHDLKAIGMMIKKRGKPIKLLQLLTTIFTPNPLT